MNCDRTFPKKEVSNKPRRFLWSEWEGSRSNWRKTVKFFRSSGDDKVKVLRVRWYKIPTGKSGRRSQKDKLTGKTRKVGPTRRVTVKIREKVECLKFRDYTDIWWYIEVYRILMPNNSKWDQRDLRSSQARKLEFDRVTRVSYIRFIPSNSIFQPCTSGALPSTRKDCWVRKN